MKPTTTIRQRIKDYVVMVRGVITTKKIAGELDLNKETVKRELYILRKAGVIKEVSRRGMLKVYALAPPPPKRTAQMCREAVLDSLRSERKNFLALAEDVGGSRNQVVTICNKLLDEGAICKTQHLEDVSVFFEVVA